MESFHPMPSLPASTDHDFRPFAANIPESAQHNRNFRTTLWTGRHLQMTLMCIPVCGEVGLEMHPHTDQFLRVEAGQALVRAGYTKEKQETLCCLHPGDGLFIPCGTWHNILNNGRCPLRLSSVYAPPQHPRGTVHPTKADADQA